MISGSAGLRDIEKEKKLEKQSPEYGGFIGSAKDFEIYSVRREKTSIWGCARMIFVIIKLCFPFLTNQAARTTVLSSRWPALFSGLALGCWQCPKEMLLEKQHSFLFKDSCLGGDAQHPEWEGREESA